MLRSDYQRENARLRIQLQEHKDYYAKVINEPCPSDEIHCTCVPALRARIEEMESQLAAERDALLTSASEVVGMDVRIKELETALKFYANKGHWMTDGLGSEPVSHIDLDGGEIARRALEKK